MDFIKEHISWFWIIHNIIIDTEQKDSILAYSIYKQLEFETAKAGQTIIKYGDEGDTFYIILKGAVEIYIPVTIEVNLKMLEYTKLLH